MLIQLSLMTIGSLCILYPVIIKARKVRNQRYGHNAIDSNYAYLTSKYLIKIMISHLDTDLVYIHPSSKICNDKKEKYSKMHPKKYHKTS